MTQLTQVEIVDVTARDGLQNESRLFSPAEKVELITRALEVGFKRLEVASFAHPKYVPQMADAEAVIEQLPDRDDVTYIGLAMNERGVNRALKTTIDEIGLVVVATNSFAQKNQGQTRQGSVDMACSMIKKIKAEGRKVNVTIGASFGCPFEGEVASETVVGMAMQLAGEGPGHIAFVDTIGVGNPWQVKDLLSKVKDRLPAMPLRGHFHNTRNTGLANVYAAVEAGISALDVSIGGIGGCPFAPAATGNVPAEDVAYMLERNGLQTGLDLSKLIGAANWLSKTMDKNLPGMVSRAGDFPGQLLAAE